MKLDLHTHCHNVTGAAGPTVRTVGAILAQVKKQGLDGLAITEHNDRKYGFKFREMVRQYYAGSKAVIIPGQELRIGYQHVVELYLADDVTFRFLAHPNFVLNSPKQLITGKPGFIHGIELANGGYQLDTGKIRELAEKFGLMLLTNSDAHSLETIGSLYNEVDIECMKKLAAAMTWLAR